MSESSDHEELVDEGLRRAAEAEMRRTLAPHPDSHRASKRAKIEGEEDAYLEVGRFDYSSVKEIATGMTCFLATCDFRREKSCTREVTSLLKPFLLPASPGKSTAADADKINQSNKDNDDSKSMEEPLISNLKVSCRGLIILKLKSIKGNEEDKDPALATAKLAQQTVLKIYDSVSTDGAAAAETVQHPHPQFIQRLIPVLSTCLLQEEALKMCAARVAGIAALEFENGDNNNKDGAGNANTPPPMSPPQLTFGIHINNRDTGIHINTNINSTGTSIDDNNASITEAGSTLERMQIINAVASGLTSELKNKYNIDAKVNLKAPAVVVSVEVMPIMGKLYAGIAILPQKVCTLKPKLGIKALRQNNTDTKKNSSAANGKNNFKQKRKHERGDP